MATHSCVLAPHLKTALSTSADSKYGRMFPDLTSPTTDENILLILGRSGSSMDEITVADEAATDNPRIPAGFPIFGQFIAHDITADRSLLLHHARMSELHNFRTPRLDLEALYSGGPSSSPYLYDLNDLDKFLIGINNAGKPNDVPRNQQGRALVGDARNDVHLFISQLHLAFLKFHNAIVDRLREQGVAAADVFREAQRLVQWHYQWIVVHEFLPLSAGEALVQDVLDNGVLYYSFDERPFIPVEFADAAYRFGHSQIRSLYTINSMGAQGQIFPDCGGTCPVPPERVVEWSYFFNTDAQRPPQASKRIDTRLAHALMDLPESVVGVTAIPEEHSLAYRDLVRGEALDLPSGEAIARYIQVTPLLREEVGLARLGWNSETPLWYYILREAEVRNQGQHLGEVGGRIITEVLLSLIDADPMSYRNAVSPWQPVLPSAIEGHFTLTDLLRFAGTA